MSDAAHAGASATIPYTRVAVALHWLLALMIAGGFALGVYMVELGPSPEQLRLFSYHKSIGITVLGLATLRSVWRLTHPAPPLVAMPAWQRIAAAASHRALYGLMLLTPLVGWLYSSASGIPVLYLTRWQLPDLVPKSKGLAQALLDAHVVLAWTLCTLVVLHIAAALTHHFRQHDETLRRMLSWRRSFAAPAIGAAAGDTGDAEGVLKP